MPVPKKQQNLMRWILFWVFLSLFIAVVIGTLGALFFGFGHLTDSERDVLFKVFIVEIGAAIIALFYSIFGLKRPGAEATRLRLDSGKFSDVQRLIGKAAVLSPSRADGCSLDDINIKVLDDNGPYIPLELPDSAYSAYITVDTGRKRYSGSFIVGTYIVKLSEEEAENEY